MSRYEIVCISIDLIIPEKIVINYHHVKSILTKVSELSRHLPTTCPESLQMRKHVSGNR
jgi:hypothetical protein